MERSDSAPTQAVAARVVRRGSRVLALGANVLNGLVYLYGAAIAGWLVLRLGWHDRWWWLFFLNSFALYLLLPVPFVVIWALIKRQRALGYIALALGGVWCWLFGGLFVPRLAPVQPGLPLRIMTYNLLGYNTRPDRVVAAIRAAQVDVVTLQELNPQVAEALSHELGTEFPYQVLDPQIDVLGMGTISRYPLALVDRLPDWWIGQPQVLRLTLDGHDVTLINAHPYSTNPSNVSDMEWSVRERQWQMHTIIDYLGPQPGPTLLATDLNTTDQNRAYALLTTVFRDAWREAGIGFGHTFPGGTTKGGSRPRVAGAYVPMWLVRIDYVMHTPHWQAVSARLGPWDGVSDHRPVIAELRLLNQAR